MYFMWKLYLFILFVTKPKFILEHVHGKPYMFVMLVKDPLHPENHVETSLIQEKLMTRLFSQADKLFITDVVHEANRAMNIKSNESIYQVFIRM